jgi:hypothetical protein
MTSLLVNANSGVINLLSTELSLPMTSQLTLPCFDSDTRTLPLPDKARVFSTYGAPNTTASRTQRRLCLIDPLSSLGSKLLGGGRLSLPLGGTQLVGSTCVYTHEMGARLASRSGANQTMGRATGSLLGSAAKAAPGTHLESFSSLTPPMASHRIVSGVCPCEPTPAEVTQPRGYESTDTSHQPSKRPLVLMDLPQPDQLGHLLLQASTQWLLDLTITERPCGFDLFRASLPKDLHHNKNTPRCITPFYWSR